MDNQHKKKYEAPALTVVTFKVEKGFADSGGILRFLALSELLSADGSKDLEYREDAGNWGNNDGWF